MSIGEMWYDFNNIRKKYKEAAPRCTECNNQLSLELFAKNQPVCNRCRRNGLSGCSAVQSTTTFKEEQH